MGITRMSSFIIGLILISLFAASIGIFMAEGNAKFGSGYNPTTIAKFNQLQNISQDTATIQDEVLGVEEKSDALDIIGRFFSSAYGAMKITWQSFSIFDDMTNSALSETKIGAFAAPLKTAIITIVIVLIVIGVFMSALIKREM